MLQPLYHPQTIGESRWQHLAACGCMGAVVGIAAALSESIPDQTGSITGLFTDSGDNKIEMITTEIGNMIGGLQVARYGYR